MGEGGENTKGNNSFRTSYYSIKCISEKRKGWETGHNCEQKQIYMQNLTNTVINIKWGVEVVWCLLTPKNSTPSSKIQKIACASVYCKPGSKHKTDLQDHMAESYNVLSTKYKRGLHFIIAGDTNELNLNPVLNLSPNLEQIVKKPTRLDPVTSVEMMLDPVITTLAAYYQTPQCLAPLDPDPETNGKPSDHRIVLVRPISAINNQCVRTTKEIIVRPMKESSVIKMRTWIVEQDWSIVHNAMSAHEKAATLQNMLLQKYNECFPEKSYKISSNDQPWISHKLKTMDRLRKREYNKHRKSEKWGKLNKAFKENVKCAKKDFYKKMVSDLMSKNTTKWYSSLKRMTSHDQHKYEKVIIPDINHLSDMEQAQKLGEHFSTIPNEYDQLKYEDIKIPPINQQDIPQFQPVQIWMILTQLKTNKSTIQGDIPAIIFKKFAAYLAEPLSHVYNSSLMLGEYPNIYKSEICTPVPKKYPVENIDQMRNISGLLTADKVFEKLLSELIISDMKKTADVTQFGNQKKHINTTLSCQDDS